MQELDFYRPDEKLIVYGSLAPGGSNAFLFAGVPGTWHRCSIRGHMGRLHGFKSFQYDPGGAELPAWLFDSPVLPRLLPDLDGLEGQEYRRVLIPPMVDGYWVVAHIYEGRRTDEEP